MEQTIAQYRMQLMSVVAAAVSVSEGCRRVGIHRSTYYGWVKALERDGIDGLCARAGRVRAKSPARRRFDAEVVALSLANPAWGPDRLFYELRAAGKQPGSVSQVWRVLVANYINTRARRYQLITATRGLHHADQILTPASTRYRAGRLRATNPGDLVQIDCFHIGSLKEARLGPTKRPGVVWQYTAIDVASSFVWAEVHTTARNPSAVHTTALAMRVAQDLAAWGWQLETISTDRGNEFVDHRFADTVNDLGATHRLIPPGRPQSNGKVEQVHNTILQECWKPAFIGYTQPSITGLRHNLDDYLDHYNHHRPHQGRWNQGQPPANIITPNTRNQP